MSARRVVITGLGMLSPVGNDVKTSWQNLTSGVSGVARIAGFDASNQTSQIAAEVKNFQPNMPPAEAKRYDRFSLFALSAAEEAWNDSGLSSASYDPTRFGVIFGIGIGGLPVMEENCRALFEDGPRKVSPFLIPKMISNLGPGNVAIKYGLQGVNYTVTSACTSGTHAIGEAFRMIRDGLQDALITGGMEASVTPLAVAGFARMKALSTRNDDPTRASRPFDRDRDGFVIAEGAGILILEELEAAKKRGAKIYAEVVGYGFSCDAHHITAPAEDGAGARNCMKGALNFGKLNTTDVTYINAHGTSTPINDPAETAAIKAVFGEHAKKGLIVSSTKSMTGHALGGAGGLEGVILAKSIQTSIIPPTVNLENPDEGCDLDYCANTAREIGVNVAISNSFGFGGTNATIAFKRFN
ncbi:beta-ketoacyl-ACP synthase II [bacterium]|nr:beta-ketoacyl-ACP synthase II [bacterium]